MTSHFPPEVRFRWSLIKYAPDCALAATRCTPSHTGRKCEKRTFRYITFGHLQLCHVSSDSSILCSRSNVKVDFNSRPTGCFMPPIQIIGVCVTELYQLRRKCTDSPNHSRSTRCLYHLTVSSAQNILLLSMNYEYTKSFTPPIQRHYKFLTRNKVILAIGW